MKLANMTGLYVPAKSPLHRLDARAKFFGFLILVAAVILSDSLYGYAIIVAVTIALAAMCGMPLGTAFASVRRLWSVFIIIFIMNAFFFETEEPIWHWWIITLSKAGMIQGFSVVFRILIIMVLSNILTLTTPPMEITGAIQLMLKPLNLLRIPADDIAMIISVAIQFIPTLLEETDTIKKAQIARGAKFESKKLRERAAAFLPLLVPIFLSAFKRADELAMAMEARGYRGAKNRTKKKTVPMTGKAWLALVLCTAICAAEIII